MQRPIDFVLNFFITTVFLNEKNMSKYVKRILVTGGAGFIGSHMVIYLVEKYSQYFVINIDKLDYCASLKNLECIKGKQNYKFIWGDICEPDFIRYVLKEEMVDTVMHFAAQSHVDQSFWSSLGFTRTNVYGTHVLVNAAYEAGITRFIHVSTDEVYGGNSTSNTESAKLKPTNPYAATKAAAEFMVISYWECFKFPVIITRANNVYGPHKYPETVIPKFISLLQQDKKCFIHGDGSNVRNFLYVSDVIQAYDVILHQGIPGETYNIGTDFKLSILQLAEYLVRKMKGADKNVNDYIELVNDRPYNDHHYCIDSSKLCQLGWKPCITWEDGINKTISWYKENLYNWPHSEDALQPFPRSSVTMKIVPCYDA